MSAFVPELLSTRCQAASQIHHALLLKALSTELSQHPSPIRGGFDGLGQDFAWLTRMPAIDLVRQSTPFVWLNVHRAVRSNSCESPSVACVRHLAMTCFDAYFQAVPEGTPITLRSIADSSSVVLPRLGVQVITGCCDSILVRTGSNTFTVETPQIRLHVDTRALRQDLMLGVSPVPLSSAKVLSTRDPALLESEYIDQVTTEGDAAVRFPQMVSSALQLIATAAPELAAGISSCISWYVAIRSPNPEVHCSFTSPQLKGVIFLSHTERDLVLAEAIVHEFGHTELNTVMDTETLSCEDPGERFYSPWRTDPRPLSGLIHALHVFSGVLEFLGQVAAHPALGRHVAYAQAERTAIYHRLRIGLMQVPDEKLTALGREIIRDIGERVMRQADELRTRSGQAPGHIHQHLEAWRAEHPELASVARMQ